MVKISQLNHLKVFYAGTTKHTPFLIVSITKHVVPPLLPTLPPPTRPRPARLSARDQDVRGEAGIRHNIIKVEGISGDIFQHLLFHKAAAAFRLRHFDVAIHVARELVRIDAGRELYVRFLRAALFKQQTAILQFGRAGFILCLLLAAFLITLNLLVVINFYPMQVGNVRMVIALVFAAGVACLGGTYGLAYWRAHRDAYAFQGRQSNK